MEENLTLPNGWGRPYPPPPPCSVNGVYVSTIYLKHRPFPSSSTINHQPSTINHQPSTINHQPSTINHQPSTINHQPSTINHQPSTINHRQFLLTVRRSYRIQRDDLDQKDTEGYRRRRNKTHQNNTKIHASLIAPNAPNSQSPKGQNYRKDPPQAVRNMRNPPHKISRHFLPYKSDVVTSGSLMSIEFRCLSLLM